MDPQAENKQETPVNPLDATVERIEERCGTRPEQQVFFIKEESTPAEKGANTVFDGLMLTLANTAYAAALEAKKGGDRAVEYRSVVRAMEPMAQICRALADNKLPLSMDKVSMQRFQNMGDSVSVYFANNFGLDERRFNLVSVFLRPKGFDLPLTVRQYLGRSLQNMKQHADPKMEIRIRPVDYPYGEVSIRFDEDSEDNKRYGGGITYDLIVGSNEYNLMDRVHLSHEETGVFTGQREGHHFSSSSTAKDLGTTFADILGAFNKKFDAHVNSRSRDTAPLPILP